MRHKVVKIKINYELLCFICLDFNSDDDTVILKKLASQYF